MSITKKSLINNRSAAKKAVIARASASPSSPIKSVAAPRRVAAVAAPRRVATVAAPRRVAAVTAPLKTF
jgi:hypothetical protein